MQFRISRVTNVWLTRTKMIPVVDKVARWSVVIISLSPVIGIIARHPMPFSLLLFLGLSGFIARMMIHAVTLPIEFDASFSKALPLLREGKYVSQSNEKAVSRILRAAALTYVSAALGRYFKPWSLGGNTIQGDETRQNSFLMKICKEKFITKI